MKPKRWHDRIPDWVLYVVILAGIVGLFVGLRLLYAYVVYGDPMCALANCRKVIP